MPTERRSRSHRSQQRPPRPSPTKIGNHKLKPQTLMLGYGFDPELSEGSLKPPIFLTSTFVFENAAAGKRFFEGVTGKRPGGAEGLIYSRFNGPNQEILEDRLAVWEDADDALAFSSGMSAIATLLLTFVRPGDCDRPFGPALCRDRDPDRQDPRPVRRVRGSTSRRARRARKSTRSSPRARRRAGVSLIYLESPANPTNLLVDVEAVAAARDAAFGAGERPPIAIDNTFLGPLVGQAAGARRRPVGLQPDQICRRAQRPRRRRPGRREGPDQPGADDPQHDRHDLRPQHRLDAAAQPRDARAAHGARGRECAPRSAISCATIRRSRRSAISASSRKARARRTSTTATAPAPGSTFSLYLKGGEKEAFAFLDALQIANLAVSLGGTETLASAPGGDDPSVGARRAQEAARHHRQPGADFDRRSRTPTTSSPTSPMR